jgi:colanic acid/amylovoran biosynthesis protein
MRNIIITGGELFNKGAQAMTFVAVHELRRRFPEHRIYLLSEMDLARPAAEREPYAFDFTGWYPIKFARAQKNPLLRLLCRLRSGAELKRCESIYKNCDAMIDISGYALGSNWSAANNDRYLNHMEFAKAFGIPVYLMPQSFGPFDFGAEHPGIDERCRKLLPGAKLILAREQEGYDALMNAYGLTNVRLAPDLVLNNRGVDLSRIFRGAPELDVPQVEPGTVGIVPNGRNLDLGNPEAVLELYAAAIRRALEQGRRVCLLHHATSDARICDGLKSRFADDDRVQLIRRELSCLEFNELVKRFDYLVGSRFHSIVHAFKNAVPCIALGWAKKYEVLLEQFGQGDYLFDVRNDPSTGELLAAMDRLGRCHRAESEKIASCLAEVQKDNVFDLIAL